jgi:hypothetical protein
MAISKIGRKKSKIKRRTRRGKVGGMVEALNDPLIEGPKREDAYEKINGYNSMVLSGKHPPNESSCLDWRENLKLSTDLGTEICEPYKDWTRTSPASSASPASQGEMTAKEKKEDKDFLRQMSQLPDKPVPRVRPNVVRPPPAPSLLGALEPVFKPRQQTVEELKKAVEEGKAAALKKSKDEAARAAARVSHGLGSAEHAMKVGLSGRRREDRDVWTNEPTSHVPPGPGDALPHWDAAKSQFQMPGEPLLATSDLHATFLGGKGKSRKSRKNSKRKSKKRKNPKRKSQKKKRKNSKR